MGKAQDETTTHERDLVSLPKAELHLHLEGAMRRSTLVELCNKHEIIVPDDTAHRRFEDFSAFVDVYVAACECLREESDIKRLVMEVAEDARDSGALWIEVAPSLTFYASRFGGMDETLKLLASAAEEAEIATGVGIGYVLSIERQLSLKEAEELAKVARRGAESLTVCGRPAVCGFGLHGPEEGNPPGPFISAFDIACSETIENSLASLPHAGEIAPSPGHGAQSVLDAVKLLKAKRIAHGTLAAENDEAILTLLESNVCLDICVSSNYLLNVVPTRESHPLPKFLKRGIACTINSDDPLLFGCTLLSEYELCRNELEMDDYLVAECAKFSFQHSCAPETIKRKGLAGIQSWLSRDPLER